MEGPEGEKVWKESGEIELARDPDIFEHLQGNSGCKGLFLNWCSAACCAIQPVIGVPTEGDSPQRPLLTI